MAPMTNTQAAMFRCSLPGLGVLYGDGTATLDPKAGEPVLVRNLLVACGHSIVPVLSLAQELKARGIAIRGLHESGKVAAVAIVAGEVVDALVQK